MDPKRPIVNPKRPAGAKLLALDLLAEEQARQEKTHPALGLFLIFLSGCCTVVFVVLGLLLLL